MDRMTPPPNYYGAPYQQNYGPNMPNNPSMPGPQPPMPNGNVNMPPQMNQPRDFEEPMYMDKGNAMPNTSDQICIGYTYADIAQANRGKKVKIYCSFTDSSQWHDMSIDGRILYAAEDHIAIETDENPSKYIVIIGIYIDYMVFLEKPNVPTKKSM